MSHPKKKQILKSLTEVARIGALTASVFVIIPQDRFTDGGIIAKSVFAGVIAIFGIRPAAGRLLTPADEPSVIVLGHEFWQQTFQVSCLSSWESDKRSSLAQWVWQRP